MGRYVRVYGVAVINAVRNQAPSSDGRSDSHEESTFAVVTTQETIGLRADLAIACSIGSRPTLCNCPESDLASQCWHGVRNWYMQTFNWPVVSRRCTAQREHERTGEEQERQVVIAVFGELPT